MDALLETGIVQGEASERHHHETTRAPMLKSLCPAAGDVSHSPRHAAAKNARPSQHQSAGARRAAATSDPPAAHSLSRQA